MYNGMVSKRTNLSNGFGRAVTNDGKVMFEGQFKDGVLHGYVRLYFYVYV